MKDKGGGVERPSTPLQLHPHFTGMKIPHGVLVSMNLLSVSGMDWFVSQRSTELILGNWKLICQNPHAPVLQAGRIQAISLPVFSYQDLGGQIVVQ